MMRTATSAALFLLLATPAFADPGFPNGWGGGSARPQDYEFGTAPIQESDVVRAVSPDHRGNGFTTVTKHAAYIKAKPGAVPNAYFIMLQCIKAENYVGKRVRVSSRLKSVDASGEQLFMRVDGQPAANGELSKVLSFYNMSDRPIKGTTDWKRYYVVLDVPQGASDICFGFTLVGGKGEAWAEDFSLDPVGKDVPLSLVPPKAPVNLSFEQ